MIDADNLKAHLHMGTVCDECGQDTHECQYDPIYTRMDICGWIDDMPTIEPQMRWISVKDRLPENNRLVLVCNDDGHMMVAQYIEETVQWQYKYTNYDVDVWDDEEQGPVCWWADLPEPPKEDTE